MWRVPAERVADAAALLDPKRPGALRAPAGLRASLVRTLSGRLTDPATGRPDRVELRFGAPVALDDLAELPRGRARREATERIMAAIHALTGQQLADDHATGGRGA